MPLYIIAWFEKEGQEVGWEWGAEGFLGVRYSIRIHRRNLELYKMKKDTNIEFAFDVQF